MKRSTIVSLVAAAVFAFSGIGTVEAIQPSSPNASADSFSETYGGGNAHNGSYGFDNSAELGIETEHADPTAVTGSVTTIEFTGPGFVEDIQAGQGTAIAHSTGDMTASTNNRVFGMIDNPTNEYYYFHSGCGYYEHGYISEGYGNYNFDMNIDMSAGQYNGALAQVGDTENNAWAGGSNFTGGSVEANFNGEGNLKTEEGSSTRWNGWWSYSYNNWNYPGTVDASLNGDITADGETLAGAISTRDADNAFSASGALTYGESEASINTTFSTNGYFIDLNFNSELHAFGEGNVQHGSRAALPDGTAVAGTYGSAGFTYDNVNHPGMNGNVSGNGIAGTGGYSNIARTANTVTITSVSVSGANANMPGRYNNIP